MAILDTFAWLWRRVRDIVLVLRPCRFSAAIVLAGGVLLATDQGWELTTRLGDEPLARRFCFQLAVLLWAVESWYWARLLLEATFGPVRQVKSDYEGAGWVNWLIENTPRVLASLAYGIAAVACGFAAPWDTAWLVAVGVLLYLGLWGRTKVLKRYLPRLPLWMQGWLVARGDVREGLRNLPRLAIAFIAASLLLAAALMAWICYFGAVGFAWTLGGAAVPFIGFAMIVPVGSLLVYWARRRRKPPADVSVECLDDYTRGYPVVLPLIVIAIVWNLVPSFDNHAVRGLKEPTPEATRTRVDFGKFVQDWKGRVPPEASARPVIVATAGGGLRAAYWTATVLGRIQDASPEFRQHLLAISGVSGGSLGATVFVTLLGQSPGGAARCNERDQRFKTEPAAGPYECAGQSVLSHDFLGPTVAALLFPDLLHRFVPVCFESFCLPDRAQGLEQSWERAWPSVGVPAAAWSDRSFLDLWPKGSATPALFLNGAHVESGRRVITSNVRISGATFADTYDFFEMTRYPIRPSTAAHNSARFTYVSPAGTLRDGTHLVDGGYFENFGAVTAREALRAAVGHLKEAGVAARPIVILISNDPKLQAGDFPVMDGHKPRGAKAAPLLSEVLSPLRALLGTRNARGLLAVADLWQDVPRDKDNKKDYFQFVMCEDKDRPEPALGWVLSHAAEALMREQLRTKACGNDREFERLKAALKRP